MAEDGGIFTHLGRMLDKGVAVATKKNDEFNSYLNKELSGPSTFELLKEYFTKAHAAKAASHIQGGESVNTANASTTPAVPKAAKSPKLMDI